MNIDFTKVKRLFVFGCSFTNYKWPTWADVLSKSIPDAEFYNFGRSGSGNLFIACRISEASLRYNFNEDDLVIVMWTSIVREDRYLVNKWIGSGNIYNQDVYPIDFVKKFSDINFYLMRDHTLTNLSMAYLKTLKCQSLNLFSFNLTDYNSEGNYIREKNISAECDKLYNFNIDDKNVLMNYMNNKSDVFRPTYDGFKDGHPDTFSYYQYLKHLGFNLTESSKEYAIQSNEKLKNIRNDTEFPKNFPELTYFTWDVNKKYSIMF